MSKLSRTPIRVLAPAVVAAAVVVAVAGADGGPGVEGGPSAGGVGGGARRYRRLARQRFCGFAVSGPSC